MYCPQMTCDTVYSETYLPFLLFFIRELAVLAVLRLLMLMARESNQKTS
jgi:hypothetical protein